MGLELLEPEYEEKLTEIQSNNQRDANECCKQMFQLWLQKRPDATWNQLIQALKQVKFDHLASKINGMLKSNGMLHITEGNYYLALFHLHIYNTNCHLDMATVNICYIVTMIKPLKLLLLTKCVGLCVGVYMGVSVDVSMCGCEHLWVWISACVSIGKQWECAYGYVSACS